MIAIDARAAVRPELGGVERWARELCRRLPRLSSDYEVLAPPPVLVHRAGHAWEQLVLPLRARRADTLLCPANLAPLAHPRTAVVIHDAAALRNPDWYSPLYARVQRALLPQVARRAAQVITVSEFSRRELAELLGVEASVVPGGVDLDRFTPEGPQAHGLPAPGSYVLTVATPSPRKNLAALAATATRLRARGLRLIGAGGTRPQFAAGETPVVEPLGPVDDADLPALYRGAAAFVLPSVYEGFGLPCLEAMACGTPVVSAATTALPEVCGDAAILCDPLDQTSIADAVEQALEESDDLRARGLRRAAGFSWDATARALDALLRG